MPEWSQLERAQNEKLALGFYLSSHPLTRHEELFARYGTATVKDLAKLSDGQEVTIGGMVTGVKVRTIKNGRNAGAPMATFSFEDLTGSVRAVAFGQAYQSCSEDIQDDREVFLRGRVRRSGEAPELMVTDVVPVAAADERLASRVVVRLSSAGADDETLSGLKKIFGGHKGTLPVFFVLETPVGRVTLEAGISSRVKAGAGLARDCDLLLGPGHLAFENGKASGNGKRSRARRN